MKISTKGQYALEVLLHMSVYNKQKLWGIKQLTEETGIAERYLEQILFKLRKKGIIKTIRGAKGGYYIGMPRDEIKLGNIIRAVEGELLPVPCILCDTSCDSNLSGSCVTKGVWYQLSEAISQVVDYQTLQDLVEAYTQEKREKDYEIIY